MPHAEPSPNPPDASGTNVKASRVHDFFPPVGNFNAVVPLSEIDSDSEIKTDSHSRATAHAPLPYAESQTARAAVRRRERDETEEATLVPSRAARTTQALPTATRRPSWPVMIAALALSLMAGLAAGVYLITSVKPAELQAPVSMTQDASHDTAAAPETSDSHPTQVASESRPEARPQTETNEVSPQAETNLDAAASDVDAEVSAEKTSRDVTAPKRVTATDEPPRRGERTSETSPARATVAERTPERPARRATTLTTNTPASSETVRTRRAASAGERTPVQRAPERSLPVSSPPPSSAKSKRVIQWP